MAFAELGQPAPWEYKLQESGSPVMDHIEWFHNWLLVIITVITLFVLGLLIAVMVKFNAKANPTPSRTTHNTLIEVAWTLIPVLILVGIAIPSFRLLFQELDIPKADLTIKATGKQWYWSYEYPDNGKFEFDSLIACDETRTKCQPPRLLSVDNELVVPVNKIVRVEDHRRRRDPLLRGAGLRHQDRRHPRPPERDLVPGDQDRHVLRPVLRAVRQGPRLYADCGAGRNGSGIRDLDRGREEEICELADQLVRVGGGRGAVGLAADCVKKQGRRDRKVRDRD